jgi:hypothetical protein
VLRDAQTRDVRQHQPAFVMAAGGDTVTCAELELRSNRLAHFLRASGLRRLDHYAIFIENNTPYVECCSAGELRGPLLHLHQLVSDACGRILACAPGYMRLHLTARGRAAPHAERGAAVASRGSRPSPRDGGGDRRSRLAKYRAAVLELVAKQPDLTLQEIRGALAAGHGIAVGLTSVWRFLKAQQITRGAIVRVYSGWFQRVPGSLGPKLGPGGRSLRVSARSAKGAERLSTQAEGRHLRMALSGESCLANRCKRTARFSTAKCGCDQFGIHILRHLLNFVAAQPENPAIGVVVGHASFCRGVTPKLHSYIIVVGDEALRS